MSVALFSELALGLLPSASPPLSTDDGSGTDPPAPLVRGLVTCYGRLLSEGRSVHTSPRKPRGTAAVGSPGDASTDGGAESAPFDAFSLSVFGGRGHPPGAATEQCLRILTLGRSLEATLGPSLAGSLAVLLGELQGSRFSTPHSSPSSALAPASGATYPPAPPATALPMAISRHLFFGDSRRRPLGALDVAPAAAHGASDTFRLARRGDRNREGVGAPGAAEPALPQRSGPSAALLFGAPGAHLISTNASAAAHAFADAMRSLQMPPDSLDLVAGAQQHVGTQNEPAAPVSPPPFDWTGETLLLQSSISAQQGSSTAKAMAPNRGSFNPLRTQSLLYCKVQATSGRAAHLGAVPLASGPASPETLALDMLLCASGGASPSFSFRTAFASKKNERNSATPLCSSCVRTGQSGAPSTRVAFSPPTFVDAASASSTVASPAPSRFIEPWALPYLRVCESTRLMGERVLSLFSSASTLWGLQSPPATPAPFLASRSADATRLGATNAIAPQPAAAASDGVSTSPLSLAVCAAIGAVLRSHLQRLGGSMLSWHDHFATLPAPAAAAAARSASSAAGDALATPLRVWVQAIMPWAEHVSGLFGTFERSAAISAGYSPPPPACDRCDRGVELMDRIFFALVAARSTESRLCYANGSQRQSALESALSVQGGLLAEQLPALIRERMSSLGPPPLSVVLEGLLEAGAGAYTRTLATHLLWSDRTLGARSEGHSARPIAPVGKGLLAPSAAAIGGDSAIWWQSPSDASAPLAFATQGGGKDGTSSLRLPVALDVAASNDARTNSPFYGMAQRELDIHSSPLSIQIESATTIIRNIQRLSPSLYVTMTRMVDGAHVASSAAMQGQPLSIGDAIVSWCDSEIERLGLPISLLPRGTAPPALCADAEESACREAIVLRMMSSIGSAVQGPLYPRGQTAVVSHGQHLHEKSSHHTPRSGALVLVPRVAAGDAAVLVGRRAPTAASDPAFPLSPLVYSSKVQRQRQRAQLLGARASAVEAGSAIAEKRRDAQAAELLRLEAQAADAKARRAELRRKASAEEAEEAAAAAAAAGRSPTDILGAVISHSPASATGGPAAMYAAARLQILGSFGERLAALESTAAGSSSDASATAHGVVSQSKAVGLALDSLRSLGPAARAEAAVIAANMSDIVGPGRQDLTSAGVAASASADALALSNPPSATDLKADFLAAPSSYLDIHPSAAPVAPSAAGPPPFYPRIVQAQPPGGHSTLQGLLYGADQGAAGATKSLAQPRTGDPLKAVSGFRSTSSLSSALASLLFPQPPMAPSMPGDEPQTAVLPAAAAAAAVAPRLHSSLVLPRALFAPQRRDSLITQASTAYAAPSSQPTTLSAAPVQLPGAGIVQSRSSAVSPGKSIEQPPGGFSTIQALLYGDAAATDASNVRTFDAGAGLSDASDPPSSLSPDKIGRLLDGQSATFSRPLLQGSAGGMQAGNKPSLSAPSNSVAKGFAEGTAAGEETTRISALFSPAAAAADPPSSAVIEAAAVPPLTSPAPHVLSWPTTPARALLGPRLVAPLLRHLSVLESAGVVAAILRGDVLLHFKALRQWFLWGEGHMMSAFLGRLLDGLVPVASASQLESRASVASTFSPAAAAGASAEGRQSVFSGGPARWHGAVRSREDLVAFANRCFSSVCADFGVADERADFDDSLRDRIIREQEMRVREAALAGATPGRDTVDQDRSAVLAQETREDVGIPFSRLHASAFRYALVGVKSDSNSRRSRPFPPEGGLWSSGALRCLIPTFDLSALPANGGAALSPPSAALPTASSASPSRAAPPPPSWAGLVISPESMGRYEAVHAFILQMHRVQWELRRLWRSLADAEKALLVLRRQRSAAAEAPPSSAGAGPRLQGAALRARPDAAPRAPCDVAALRLFRLLSLARHEANFFVAAVIDHLSAHALHARYGAMLHSVATQCQSIRDLRRTHDEYTRSLAASCLIGVGAALGARAANRPGSAAAATHGVATKADGAKMGGGDEPHLLDAACDAALEMCRLAHSCIARALGGCDSNVDSASPPLFAAESAVWHAAEEARIIGLHARFRSCVRTLLVGLEALHTSNPLFASAAELLARLASLVH